MTPARTSRILSVVGPVILGLALDAAATPRGGADLASFVNPMIGTEPATVDFGTGGGAGNTFPGAVVPFGMLQWSPDTLPGIANPGGGYSHSDSRIRGFSLTHLSGAGCSFFMDFPFLPTTTPVVEPPAVAGTYDVAEAYLAGASFSHSQETAEPGYYRVLLGPEGSSPINVELAAATRSGQARITFPAGPAGSILFNAGGSAMANGDAAFVVDPVAHEVRGTVTAGQFCYQRNTYAVHFVARFEQAPATWGTWEGQSMRPGTTSASAHVDAPFQLRPVPGLPSPPHTSNAAQVGVWVTFDTSSVPVVAMRVGLSFTSQDAARANLDAEVAASTFDEVRSAARTAWNDALGAVEVSGGSEERTRTFYSMLYRSMMFPSVFSDHDGRYLGMDGAEHTAAGRVQYTNFSGWDIYRTQFPLLAMLFPARASDMAASLLADARESGWLPKWPVANGQTNVMVGDPADAILAEAHAFGARGFDAAEALDAMVRGATQAGKSPNAEYMQRAGLDDYLSLGWVAHDGTQASSGTSTSMFGSTDAVWGSAATTLEYAIADFAIARLAAALGEVDLSRVFLDRADNWQNLFLRKQRLLVPRFRSGGWPASLGSGAAVGFVEGSAFQYTWMVPHNQARLLRRLGGRRAVAARLDDHLSLLNEGPHSFRAYLGNEPGLGTPWTSAWLGRPWKAQSDVRRAIDSLYADSPSGYPGNDDLGTLSAWYVFASLGLYPAIPGDDVLVVGSPLFPHSIVHLQGGDLVIDAPDTSDASPWVGSLTLDGQAVERSWLRFPELACGAVLAFSMQAEPSTSWASRRRDAPPSYDADATLPAASSLSCP